MIIHCSRTTVMSDMSKGQLRIVACHLGTWQIGSSQETSLKLQEHQVLQLQGVCANYTKTKLIQRQTQTANFPLYNFLRLQVTSSAEMTGIFSGQSFKMVVETSGTSGKCIPCGVIAFVKQLEMFSIRNTHVKIKFIHYMYIKNTYNIHQLLKMGLETSESSRITLCGLSSARYSYTPYHPYMAYLPTFG